MVPVPPRMLDVTFEEILSILHGWLGQEVKVGVNATDRPVQVASLDGALGATGEMLEPYDHDEWEFSIGAHGGFGLHRHYVAGANLFPDSGRLIILLHHNPEQPDGPGAIDIHIVGPAVQR